MSEPQKIVDPHIHLWDLSTGLYPGFAKPSKGFIGSNAAIARSYLIEEYLDEGEDAVEISGAVHVEAFPTDPIKETETLQRVADAAPIPLVIVANADLTAPDFAALLDKHAAFPIFRGIRQVINRHANPGYNYVAADFMRHPAFLDSLKLLGSKGGSFDLQLYPHQADEAAALIANAPETPIVLNHAGMWVDRTLEGWKAWKASLKTLAALPNVSVKISGLGMFDRKWTLESIRPLALETIEAFGTDRAMFASNFPVDKLFSDYPTLWRSFATIIQDFTEAEREALFAGNARRIYRLPDTRAGR
jgi:predicted TIM-barrel fold metal-dependent hydrolase